jgi:hypothetical protein
MDISDSEHTLVGTLDIQDLDHYAAADNRRRSSTSPQPQTQQKDTGSIERRVDYCVVKDDQYAIRFGNYTGVWAGNHGNPVPQTRSRYFGDHIHQHAYSTNKA